jgi:predicted HicB family RNase H-like nuclease
MIRNSVFRVRDEVHKQAKVASAVSDSMIAEFVEQAIREKIRRDPELRYIIDGGDDDE